MKPNRHLVRLAALVAFAAVGPVASLSACEGEPPVAYPENAPAAASGGVPAPEAESTAEASSAVASVPAQPPTAPCTPCAAHTADASTRPGSERLRP